DPPGHRRPGALHHRAGVRGLRRDRPGCLAVRAARPGVRRHGVGRRPGPARVSLRRVVGGQGVVRRPGPAPARPQPRRRGRRRPMRSVAAKVTVVALVQLVLLAVAVAPRVSPRLTGDEYLLRVAPVDPIDPFRGAYVDLDYPDLDLD